MAKGKLFEYVVLYHPKTTKEEQDKGIEKKSEVVQDVTRVLAESDREVMILAARSIPSQYVDKLEQVDIVVRPF